MKINILIALVALLVSCSKMEELATEVLLSDVEATFSAQITTRTSGNSWVEGDEIGIFMYSSGDTTTPIYQNVKYISDQDGDFTVDPDEESAIYYPQSGSVDFYAYYPYDDEIDGTICNIETVTQNSRGKSSVDLITASIKGISKSTSAQTFLFTHQLSNLIIEVSTTDDIVIVGDFAASLSEVMYHTEVDILGVTEPSLYNSAESINFSVDDEQIDQASAQISQVTASAIMAPQVVNYSSTRLTIEATIYDPVLGEQTIGSFSTLLFDEGFELLSGMSHTFNVTLTLNDIYIDASTISDWGAGTVPSSDKNMDVDKVEND